jgi:hypothetical protein
MPTSNNTDNDTKQRAKAPDSGDVAPAPRVGEPGHPMTPSSFNGRVESDKPTRAQQAIIDERDRRRARKIVDLEEASADAASLDPERAVVIDCREKPPAPKMLIEHLIYRGASHWLAGHVKDGKSIIALWAANEIMENGGHVLWMDWENGTTRLQRWLYELGANPEIVERQFHLYDSPSLGLGGEAIEAQFDAWAERWPDALVVIDSMSKALPSGLSDNSADDVTDWTMGILKPLTRRAFTPIVIDHERKDGSAKDRYGRGSGAKGADADVSLHREAAPARPPRSRRVPPGGRLVARGRRGRRLGAPAGDAHRCAGQQSRDSPRAGPRCSPPLRRTDLEGRDRPARAG